MQIIKILKAVGVYTFDYILLKINKLAQKMNIMLFSNVLFLCTRKHGQKATYC